MLFEIIFYFFKYTLPVWFCGIAFFLGGGLPPLIYDARWEAYEQAQIEKNTHTVTIYWDETKNDSTTVDIRSDLEWTISGCNITLPLKDGYEFAGLYTSSYGGTQFVNSAGYVTRTIHDDIELYACWRRKEVISNES